MGADVADGQTSETTSWQKVDLPHTWNIADTLDDEPGYRRGISWYRKQLELGPQLSQKRIFIYFEGVNQTAEIFVNGKPVGRHIGGYSAFVFDVTELVRFDSANAIAVKVDNTLVNYIPPLDADFNMHGGIYRDAVTGNSYRDLYATWEEVTGVLGHGATPVRPGVLAGRQPP